MRFTDFFIRNPIFAAVISLFIVLFGLISYMSLPVAQFPEIVPPSVVVTASLPGASPQALSDSVIAPLEQSINGVDAMTELQSQAASDGTVTITVNFAHGTNPDLAQVLVQNRVSAAEPRLPEAVRRSGVTVRKRSSDQLAAVHLYSTDRTRDTLFLTNYAISQMSDRLARLSGVSDITVFGSREYSIRIWLDSDRLMQLGLSPTEVVQRVQEQNRNILAGKVNAPKMTEQPGAFELLIRGEGRLREPQEYDNIVIRRSADGRTLYLKDIARTELASYNYDEEFYRDGVPAMGLAIFQTPGANAISTMKAIRAELEEIQKELPSGVDCYMTIDNTEFIENSIRSVYQTLFEATALVVLVILLFLHNWKSSLIPILSIPVSIIGTFIVMKASGFTINNLTLFGLILATGIVVDDAIVVVEAIEAKIRNGMSPLEAGFASMKELSKALVGIAAVLSCVFIPTAFLSGITGSFYRQFALTIAAATIISAFVSLTLSPALSVPLLSDRKKEGWFSSAFNHFFGVCSEHYSQLVRMLVKLRWWVLAVYAVCICFTVFLYTNVPSGFIPRQDNNYLSASIQLAEGIALNQTDETLKKAQEALSKVKGVQHFMVIVGQSGATRSKASNAALMVIKLEPQPERIKEGLSIGVMMSRIRSTLNEAIPEASVNVLAPPAVMGIGAGGDFQFYLQDRIGLGVNELTDAAQEFIRALAASPEIESAFSSFRTDTPQLELKIDREKAAMLRIDLEELSNTIQYEFGSVYVNDFNLLNRVFRVVAQSDSEFRSLETDLDRVWIKNELGRMVPLSSVVSIERTSGPQVIARYNMYPSVFVLGNISDGVSSTEAISVIEKMAAETLPEGISLLWTSMIKEQKQEDNTNLYIFGLCLLCVFLSLAALYESLRLPLIIILIVPQVLLFGLIGLELRGLDNSLMAQIGFVVLIGLACKNSILIVEMAKQFQQEGLSRYEAIVRASAVRLRAILMTSFAFILGVVPLAFSSGYGSELRQAVGTTVFAGMLGVTFIGLVFTPVFYALIAKK
ncbi:efflux RND transporter permease subunit [uncultured Parasutterella sp.]|uniref:efflux RND transporter permease subunit n=2 Tax=uncultured Parasutterella sp. TaxID=1263098 RepID=UPI0025B72B83|nr:efflux RND transporter permease subunit [uncultured Parasutterella sp.]